MHPAPTPCTQVGATPAFLAVQGELEVGYRITVAGRDGKLYTIR